MKQTIFEFKHIYEHSFSNQQYTLFRNLAFEPGFSTCLSVKYNRINNPDDVHETKWHAGPWQYALLIVMSAMKFVFPTFLMYRCVLNSYLRPLVEEVCL